MMFVKGVGWGLAATVTLSVAVASATGVLVTGSGDTMAQVATSQSELATDGSVAIDAAAEAKADAHDAGFAAPGPADTAVGSEATAAPAVDDASAGGDGGIEANAALQPEEHQHHAEVQAGTNAGVEFANYHATEAGEAAGLQLDAVSRIEANVDADGEVFADDDESGTTANAGVEVGISGRLGLTLE